MKQKLIIKIGTSTLTGGGNYLRRGKLEDLAQQLVVLKAKYDIIIVSSGAVAAAKQTIKWAGGTTDTLAHKQALAAIGQPFLMQRYREVFSDFNLNIAQCLLTYYDVNNETSKLNILNTINVLLQNDYIPIINENDTVAVEEIKFGDNDKLAALVAVLVNANLVILASDIDGLYDSDPKENPNATLVSTVNNIKDVQNMVGNKLSSQGTGGMQSKLIAAELCMQHNIPIWIINGQKENFIINAMEGKLPFTKFVS
jgi:glutamate 5-kinase